MTTAFKGFNADFRCRGFQYEVGKTYKHEGAVEACRSGFHACENPFDVWQYYPAVNGDGRIARYAMVELGGTQDRGGDKIAAAEITIAEELSLRDFLRHAIASAAPDASGEVDTGDDARIGSSGYAAKIGSSGKGARIASSGGCAKIGSSGYYAQIGSSGGCAQIGSCGDDARIASSGGCAQIGSSGYYAQIGSCGDDARIASSGGCAKIVSLGDYAKIASSGYGAQIVCEGQRAVVASSGGRAIVTGKAGTWVSLACYDVEGNCIGFATGCIGQDGLKPGTPYRAEGGKLVEVTK